MYLAAFPDSGKVTNGDKKQRINTPVNVASIITCTKFGLSLVMYSILCFHMNAAPITMTPCISTVYSVRRLNTLNVALPAGKGFSQELLCIKRLNEHLCSCCCCFYFILQSVPFKWNTLYMTLRYVSAHILKWLLLHASISVFIFVVTWAVHVKWHVSQKLLYLNHRSHIVHKAAWLKFRFTCACGRQNSVILLLWFSKSGAVRSFLWRKHRSISVCHGFRPPGNNPKLPTEEQPNSSLCVAFRSPHPIVCLSVCLQTFCYEAKIVRTGVHGHKHEQWPHLWTGSLGMWLTGSPSLELNAGIRNDLCQLDPLPTNTTYVS